MSKSTANNDYKRRNYDRILLQFPAGSRERLREAAQAAGYSSVNAWAAAILGRAAGADLSLRGEFGPRKPSGAGATVAAWTGAAGAGPGGSGEPPEK